MTTIRSTGKAEKIIELIRGKNAGKTASKGENTAKTATKNTIQSLQLEIQNELRAIDFSQKDAKKKARYCFLKLAITKELPFAFESDADVSALADEIEASIEKDLMLSKQFDQLILDLQQ